MKSLCKALKRAMIKKLEKHNTYYIGLPPVVKDDGDERYIFTQNDLVVEIFDEKAKNEAIQNKYKGIIYKILFAYKDYNDLKKKIEEDVDLNNEEKSKIEPIYISANKNYIY